MSPVSRVASLARYAPVPMEPAVSLQQSILATQSRQPVAPGCEAPQPGAGNDALLSQVVSALVDYLAQSPAASLPALDQQLETVFHRLQPGQPLLVSDKLRVVGYALKQLQDQGQVPGQAGLRKLQVNYLMVGQFASSWSDQIFKKPDDEEHQW